MCSLLVSVQNKRERGSSGPLQFQKQSIEDKDCQMHASPLSGTVVQLAWLSSKPIGNRVREDLHVCVFACLLAQACEKSQVTARSAGPEGHLASVRSHLD